MRLVGAVDGSAAPSLGGRGPGRPVGPDAGATTATALVAAAPARPPEAGYGLPRRPLSAFLAHLIATRRGEPQTRARRRVDTAHAIDRYAAADTAPSTPPPVLLRSL